MTDDQIYKIKAKTEWDEERRKWKLPQFIIKQKEIQLPQLGMAGNKDFINEELENQEVLFSTPGGGREDRGHNQYTNQSMTSNSNGNHYGNSMHSQSN